MKTKFHHHPIVRAIAPIVLPGCLLLLLPSPSKSTTAATTPSNRNNYYRDTTATTSPTMCTVDYSATCSSIGRESVSTVTFRVVADVVDENENSSSAFVVDPPSSSYEATVAFLWGEDDRRDDIGNDLFDNTNTTIILTDVYPTGEIITLSDKYTYDEPGLYRVGYRFRFGIGAGSCENKTSSILSLIRIEERSCQWGVDVGDDIEVAEVVDEIHAGVGDLEEDVGLPAVLSHVPSISPTANPMSSGAKEIMGKNESLTSVIISEPVNEATNSHTSNQNDHGDDIPDDDVESSSASPPDNNSKNETTIPTSDDIENEDDNKTSTLTGVTPIDQTMETDSVKTASTTIITRTWPPSMAPLNERESDSAGVAITMRESMGCCLCSMTIIILWVL